MKQDPIQQQSEREGDPPPVAARFGAGVALAMRWAAGLVSIALIAMIVVWTYRLGVRDAAELPVIRARTDPARIQPENPGGSEIANQGLEVNDVLAGQPATTVAPRARAPAPPTLADDDQPVAPPQVQAEAEAEAPVEVIAPPVTEAAEAVVETPPPSLGSVIDQLVAEAVSDQLRPRLRPENLQPASPELPPSRAATPVPVLDIASPADLQPGSRLVQLGEFETRTLARGAWEELMRNQGDLLQGKRRHVEGARVGGRSFARLRAFGFDSFSEAEALCEALRARGVACVAGTVQ